MSYDSTLLYPFPFRVTDYPDDIKYATFPKSSPLSNALRIIDNDGDPGWCFHKNQKFCRKKNLLETTILEYKRRIMINMYDLLKKKSLPQIKKYIKKTYPRKKFTRFKTKETLIRAFLIFLHKKSWKELKSITDKKTYTLKNKFQQKRRKTKRKN